MINSWVAELTALLTIGATVLPVSAAQGTVLAGLLGANQTTLELSDGVYTEVVRATASGSVVTITRAQEGTTARAFAIGACAAAKLTAAGLTELVCASNCGCTMVELRAGANVTSPKINELWAHSWFFTGTQPLGAAALVLPAWATLDTSQMASGLLSISGTPITPDTSVPISIVVNGCNGSVVIIEETIDVCSPTGLAY